MQVRKPTAVKAVRSRRKTSSESRVGELVDRVLLYQPTADTEQVRRAYEFCAEVHQGQMRLSGEPYLTHPLAVAEILAELKLDVPTVVGGLLHDTVEDTLATHEQIEDLFGAEVAALVDGVTKLSRVNFTSHEEKQAENFRKMVLAMAKDIRVVLIKLADRTHNMRTLDHLPRSKQRRIAQETLDIYAPLAHRLGIYWVKSELEDLALKHLKSEVYAQLKQNVAQKKGDREKYTNEVISQLSKNLAEEGIDAEVSGRPKHFYSIFLKMENQSLDFSQVYDLVAFRIVVDTPRECYEALGVVHLKWKPIPGRFKDYIALAKPNMYQSLHTAVIGPQAQRIEIQIRTHEMHRVAEEGIASHWRYKEANDLQVTDVQRFAWLRQLLEWEQNLSDPQEFLHSIKEDLFPDEVYVFTPAGDLLSFPKGSTVVDFAYRIHSDIGHQCSGARVNGRLVPFKYILRSGDAVEIITTQEQTPSRDWLKLVKTIRAKSRIRNWLKTQQRERSVALGREILEGDFARHGLSYGDLRTEGKLETLGRELGVKNEEGLLAGVGYGKMMPRQVLAKLLPADKLDEDKRKREGGLERLFRLVGGRDRGVRVKGIEEVLVRFARCCHPLPGEDIVGFITRGRGVTVHVASCPTVLESDPARKVDVSWEAETQIARGVKIEVSSVDRPGLLAAISSAISEVDVNIARAHVRTFDDKAVNTFEVMIGSSEELRRVLRSISKVKGVFKANRVQG